MVAGPWFRAGRSAARVFSFFFGVRFNVALALPMRALFLTAASLAATAAQPQFSPALPSAGALRYASWNLTMFVHFSITTFTGSQSGAENPALFAPPADFTMDTWLDAAAALGAPVAVLTSKHEAGFVLWQTATASRDFSVAASPTVAARDLVAEFVAACAARGILPGLYFTTTDAWAHANLNSSAAAALQLAHMAELLARHGRDIHYWWFDHHKYNAPWPTIDAMVAAANPEAVVLGLDTQQVGAELGAAPYPLISPCFTNGNNSAHGRCIGNDLGAPLFKSPENAAMAAALRAGRPGRCRPPLRAPRWASGTWPACPRQPRPARCGCA